VPRLSAADEQALVGKLRKAKLPAKAIAKITKHDPATVFWGLLERGALSLHDVAKNDGLVNFSYDDPPSGAVLAFAKTLTECTVEGLRDVLPGLSAFVNEAIASAYKPTWNRSTFAPRVRDSIQLARAARGDAIPERERLLDELAANAFDPRYHVEGAVEALGRDPSLGRRLAAHLETGPTPDNLFRFPEVFAHLSWSRIAELLEGADLYRREHHISSMLQHRPETTAEELLWLADRLRARVTTGRQANGANLIFAAARERGATAVPGPEWDPVFELAIAALDVASVLPILPGVPRERILALYDRTRAGAELVHRRAWSYPLLGLAYDERRARDAVETCVSYSNADYLGMIGPRAVPFLEAALASARDKDAREHFREALAVARATLDRETA
jgi:hypothetical protein